MYIKNYKSVLIRQLKIMKKNKKELKPDFYFKFFEENQEMLKEKYKNQYIAVHEEKGLVFHNESLTKVLEDIKKSNLDPDKVCVDKINEHPFIGAGAYTFSQSSED